MIFDRLVLKCNYSNIKNVMYTQIQNTIELNLNY